MEFCLWIWAFGSLAVGLAMWCSLRRETRRADENARYLASEREGWRRCKTKADDLYGDLLKGFASLELAFSVSLKQKIPPSFHHYSSTFYGDEEWIPLSGAFEFMLSEIKRKLHVSKQEAANWQEANVRANARILKLENFILAIINRFRKTNDVAPASSFDESVDEEFEVYARLLETSNAAERELKRKLEDLESCHKQVCKTRDAHWVSFLKVAHWSEDIAKRLDLKPDGKAGGWSLEDDDVLKRLNNLESIFLTSLSEKRVLQSENKSMRTSIDTLVGEIEKLWFLVSSDSSNIMGELAGTMRVLQQIGRLFSDMQKRESETRRKVEEQLSEVRSSMAHFDSIRTALGCIAGIVEENEDSLLLDSEAEGVDRTVAGVMALAALAKVRGDIIASFRRPSLIIDVSGVDVR